MEKNDANQNDERRAAIIGADANGYAKSWADSQQLKPAESGLWKLQGEWRNTEQVRELFIADYSSDHAKVCAQIVRGNFKAIRGNELKAPRILKGDLFKAIDETLAEKVRVNLEETRTRLTFDPEADKGGNLITSFVSNLTNQNVEVATAVMSDYIWVAKRRLYALPVENHVIPFIVGGQGFEKSMNIDRLLSPLADYRLSLPGSYYLNDSRYYFKFSNNYVAVLEELSSRNDNAELAMLLNFTTKPVLHARALGAREAMSVPNNLTLIGTSNHLVKHKLLHNAYPRRIYEIIVDREITQQVSESISYTKLWQGVDENGPSPILPYLSLLNN